MRDAALDAVVWLLAWDAGAGQPKPTGDDVLRTLAGGNLPDVPYGNQLVSVAIDVALEYSIIVGVVAYVDTAEGVRDVLWVHTRGNEFVSGHLLDHVAADRAVPETFAN